MDKITSEKILKDFKQSKSYWKPLHDASMEDFEFSMGKQWKDEDKQKLEEKQGVKALTINKIQPLIFMLSGIQRQNRTDIVAFPEGKEDGLEGEIVTRLIHYLSKQSQEEYAESEQFEDGIIGGFGYLEPFISYKNDFINGELQWSKCSPFQIYASKFKKYDMSDCRFVIKFSDNLSKDDLLILFPDNEKEINKLESGKINVDSSSPNTKATQNDSEADEEKTYDLVEYYYKRPTKHYIVVDEVAKVIKEIDNKDAADEYAIQFNATKPGSVKVLERRIEEIWCAKLVGDKIFDDSIAWTFPRWKSFPFIPFFAHWITTPIDNKELMIQGIVRSLKDQQIEINKRRTQVLRILNSTANSGWLTQAGAWVNKKLVETFGSVPGIILEYKKDAQAPIRIEPPSFPAAHDMLAKEASSEIKESSGINTDLLAMNEGQASGRAIHLRQQQGLVMIQRIMDNFSQTKSTKGRFEIAMLGELFTLESAAKVLGEEYLKDNFSKPVMAPSPAINPQDGQPIINPQTMQPAMEIKPQLNAQGEIQTEIDQELVNKVITAILTDTGTSKYNIEVSEGMHTETVKYGNYLMLMDMIKNGMPIPPDVIIDESQLSEGSKSKIRKVITAQQAAMATPPGAPMPPIGR